MEPIKNGLKVWLESKDLTSSSTTWEDRSGNNNNFTITGSPVVSDGLAVFSEDWYAKIDNLNINYGSIELTAAYNENSNVYGFGSWERNNWKFSFGDYRIHARRKSNPSNYAFDYNLRTSQNVKSNDIVTYGLTYNEGTYNIFCNGKIIQSGIHSDIPTITSFYLGLKSDDNTKRDGKIKSLRIYNRKLEHHEILANYQYELLNRNINSYVNETNLPKIVDKLTDASNIKIANNKYGNRVQTVIDKIVEKADNVTKAVNQEVINDGYSFKVGTGNVDVSTDVEDGFGEVGVKGVTYQNIAYKNENIPSNCSYSKETGEGVINYNASHLNGFNFSKDLLKPNTLYTVIINIKENSLVTTSGKSLKLQMAENNTAKYVANGFVGQLKATISTKEISSSFGIVTVTAGATEGRVVFDGYMVLEGDHVDKSNIPSKISNIVGVGDKSKNLFDGKNVSIGYLTATGAINASGTTCRVTDYIEVKSNTSYTVNNPAGETHCFYDSDKNFISYVGAARTFITPANCKYVRCTIKRTDYDSTFQLEEGTKATPYEPYYDGHKIEILSHGKNLYKPNLQTKSANGLTFSLHGNTLIVNGTCTKIVDFRPINGTESITLKLYNYVNKLPAGTTLKLSNNLGLKNFFSLKRNGVQTYPANTLIIQEGDYGISCFIRFEEGQSYNNAELKIQLEINNVATEFEPYVEDKTQILLDEPLMRLPNGVCDEITRDGKLIRKVGKKFIDANISGLAHNATSSNHNQFVIHKEVATPNSINHANLLCDKKPCKVENGGNNSVWIYNKATLVFQMDSTINSAEKMRQWLSQNPTTVYYELETPIITELPAPYLRIFKDGHLTFNTLVAPESNHVVQLNKSGQIQNAIKESQSLDNRINVLENNYDNLMLSTISRLNNLELDYTLK